MSAIGRENIQIVVNWKYKNRKKISTQTITLSEAIKANDKAKR